MSDPQADSHSQTAVPADPSHAVRVEVQREYAAKLAKAEFKAQAAQAGATLGEGFTEYLDTSKLLGEDGTPSAEAITRALAPMIPERPAGFPQLAGAGFHRSGDRVQQHPRISLDVRKR
ncbi:hypothetical protein AB0L75_00810 [Streptomyces sp. NPDC052101]|uniref:hypothetical protein n=1 Tax=Streptomyces sp. NPDC052101 TaxID=3155763 RepID=UPI0034396210